MLKRAKSAGADLIKKVTSAFDKDEVSRDIWNERWKRRMQGGDFGITLQTALPQVLVPLNVQRDAATVQVENSLSSLSLDTKTTSSETLFRCSTIGLVESDSLEAFEDSLRTSFPPSEGKACTLEEFAKENDLIKNLEPSLLDFQRTSHEESQTFANEETNECSGFVSVTDFQNQAQKWKGECSFSNLYCTEGTEKEHEPSGPNLEKEPSQQSLKNENVINETTQDEVEKEVENTVTISKGEEGGNEEDREQNYCKKSDSNNSGQEKVKRFTNKVSPAPSDMNNHSNDIKDNIPEFDKEVNPVNSEFKSLGNINNHSNSKDKPMSKKFTGVTNMAYQSSDVSWESIEIPKNLNLERTLQSSEKKSFLKKSTSLMEGEEAFRHYKLFTAVENSMYKKRIEMAKHQILEDYDWKVNIIDGLLQVARAYYMDPTAANRKRWKSLRRDIDQKSAHSITDRRVRLGKVSSFFPFFTIIIMIVQTVLCVTMVSVEGLATVNTVSNVELQENTRTMLGSETVDKWEEVNMWVGFNSRVMTEMGGILAVCMREDINLHMLGVNRKYSHLKMLGCCELTARNTAATTTAEECINLTLGVGVWKNVTCNQRRDNHVPHVLKPCCVDLKGTCSLTSQEHCAFLGGVFHVGDAEHCSQVNCPNSICGMGGITSDPINKWLPTSYQWWRPLVSLVYCHGVLHLLLVLAGEWLLLRQVEKSAGWLRVAVIYVLAGIIGGMCASLFSPFEPQVGTTAAVMASLGVIHMELIEGWRFVQKAWLELIKIHAILIFVVITGTLPGISNAAIITGFITGILSAVAFLPYIHLRLWSPVLQRTAVITALFLLIMLFFFVVYSFHYIQSLYLCEWCKLVECRNYVENMCPHH